MKHEAMEVLRNRRSIRQYKSEQVSASDLDAVLELGTYAPTAKGLQSPVIVSVQDAEIVKELGQMNAKVMGTDDNPYHDAPTILLVFAPKSVPTHIHDGSAVLTQLAIAAYAVGLGSCWINREKQMFETERGKELMEKWGLNEDYVGIGGLALGYPDENPEPKARKEGYVIKA